MDIQEKLIELVKSHDFLYNLDSPSYKDIPMKIETWNKIGRELRTSGDLCRKKWKSLRDSYKRVKQCDSLRKPWKYEAHMRFLDDVQSSRNIISLKTEEAFYEDETDTAGNQQEQQFDVTIYNEQEVSTEADFEIENFDLNDYVKKIDTTTTTTTTTKPANTSTTTTTTVTKKYDKDALIQEACHEMTTLLQNAKKHFTPPSSNQVFFNSMALQVEEAQLPALTQMRLQQRILEIVTLEIVNHQQNNIQQL